LTVFSYYGEKRELAHYYPEPVYGLVIEPFAGSAAYSLHGDRWKQEVLLIERDPRIAGVWEWLIEEADRDEILALPDLVPGERSRDLLHIVAAATRTANRADEVIVTPALAETWKVARSRMADAVGHVKHWSIRCGEYTSAPEVEATWFVDPPYVGEPGAGYRFGSDTLDFEALGDWIQHRAGQVIACEGGLGTYLPFEPLRPGVDLPGRARHEFVWCSVQPSEEVAS
jgi:hypothetical protein